MAGSVSQLSTARNAVQVRMRPQQHRGPLTPFPQPQEDCWNSIPEFNCECSTVIKENKYSPNSLWCQCQGPDKETVDPETWDRDIWVDKPENLELHIPLNTKKSSVLPLPRREHSSCLQTLQTPREAGASQGDACLKICLYFPYFLQTNWVRSGTAQAGRSKAFSGEKYSIPSKKGKIW